MFRSQQTQQKQKIQRKRSCYFCVNHLSQVNYKDVQVLRRFVFVVSQNCPAAAFRIMREAPAICRSRGETGAYCRADGVLAKIITDFWRRLHRFIFESLLSRGVIFCWIVVYFLWISVSMRGVAD